ncbi:TPA: acyltransferase family protein, partial [Escherichia coli]|nr:acyltransferase family protein [Escherichia coli]
CLFISNRLIFYGIIFDKYNKSALLLCIVGYIITIIFTLINFHVFGNNQASYGIGMNMAFCAIGLFILFQSIKESVITRNITKLSKYTHDVYLTHIFMMYYISAYIKIATTNDTFNSLLTVVASFIMALIFPFVIDNVVILRMINKLKLRSI